MKIAAWSDGSGQYRATRQGDILILSHPDGMTQFQLTRAADLDNGYDDVMPADYALTDRLAWCDDLGTNGVVWIDGAAYRLEPISTQIAEGGYDPDAPHPDPVARLEIARYNLTDLFATIDALGDDPEYDDVPDLWAYIDDIRVLLEGGADK